MSLQINLSHVNSNSRNTVGSVPSEPVIIPKHLYNNLFQRISKVQRIIIITNKHCTAKKDMICQTFQNQLWCVQAGAVPAGVRVPDHHLPQPDRHGPGAVELQT